MRLYSSCVLAVLVLQACEASGPPPAAQAIDSPAIAPAPDSVTSMAYLLRRFQSQVRSSPTDLDGGATDRETLARHLVTALERYDTAAIERMVVTPAEFGHLYFPESIFMRPPYELDPAVVWMQLDAATSTGMRRALQHYGGTPLGFLDLTCSPPQVQGSMRIHGCDVRRLDGRGDTVTERMFGPILERGGRFKFLSLQNKL